MLRFLYWWGKGVKASKPDTMALPPPAGTVTNAYMHSINTHLVSCECLRIRKYVRSHCRVARMTMLSRRQASSEARFAIRDMQESILVPGMEKVDESGRQFLPAVDATPMRERGKNFSIPGGGGEWLAIDMETRFL